MNEINDFSFLVDKDNSNLRIDKFIKEKLIEISRNNIQKLIEEKNILINQNPISKNYKVKTGDKIDISIPKPRVLEQTKSQNLNLNIIYEDDDLLIVDKPKGMVVHPAVGNYENTLVNGLLFHCEGNLSGINGVIRPGIVHRIDKNTSGLLIVAKNDFSHNFLANQIKEHSFTREYLAVIYGRMKEEKITINAPIGRNPKDRKKMAITDKNSKNAVTHCVSLKKYKGFELVKLILETGRTHQIRVHMSSIGHPIAGDDVYGPKKVISELKGQCLHAYKIGFIHPKTQKYIEFESKLPDYFENFIKKLEKVD